MRTSTRYGLGRTLNSLKKIVLIFCIAIPAFLFSYSSFGSLTASAALAKADKVIVFKSKHLLMLMREDEIMRVYKVALGKQPVGRKIKAGDKRTPEGKYVLDARKPDSKFHLALHISYPNESDIVNAQKNGVSPGGDVMIHGLPDKLKDVGKLHRISDWTNGCIAVTNSEIEEIWRLVPDGTGIEIVP
jgi:murein L,D-transpeptidase YafK